MSGKIQQKLLKTETPDAISAELGPVIMSSEALSKMSLNPYDQLFICRLMGMRDEAVKDEMATALAEVLAAQNKRMFETLDDQTKLIKGIALDISEIKNRLNEDEKQLAEMVKQVKSIHKRLGIVETKVKGIESCKL